MDEKAIENLFRSMKTSIDLNFDSLNRKIDGMDMKITNMDEKLATFHATLFSHEEKITSIERDIIDIKKDNITLAGRLEKCQKALKKKSIIIFHLDEKEEKGWEGLRDYIAQFTRSLLKVELDFNRIDEIYRIGPKYQDAPPRPIRITFVDNSYKWTVLKSASNLKYSCSRVGISQDFTDPERLLRRELAQFLKVVKRDDQNAKIKGFTVIINNVSHSLPQLRKKFPAVGDSSGERHNRKRENSANSPVEDTRKKPKPGTL